MEIGVGVKLARHQVVKFPRTRRKDECQAVDDRVNQACLSRRQGIVCVVYARNGEMLPQDKGEVEGEFLVARQAQQKGRRSFGEGRRFGVLQTTFSNAL